MTEKQPVYENAVTTARSAEMLARRHGYKSVARLAETLPPGARVLDVGAGASPFGKKVADLRPDITWVNFDYSYSDPAILEEVRKDSPDNIEYVAGDATKLSEAFEPETFDTVFSYWLLPHLSIDDPAPANKAARDIFSVTKTGGTMSVGPNVNRILLAPPPAIQTVKDASLDVDEYADRITAATKLPKATRYLQKLANEVATPFFGTTRYTKKEGWTPKVYHPESGEYVSPFGLKGIRTIGRLAIAAAAYSVRQLKAKS